MPAVLSGVPGYGSTFPSLGTTRGGAKVPTTNVPLPRCARRTTPAVTGAVRVRGGCGSVRWFGGHAGRPMGHGQTTAGEWGRGHGHLRYVGPGAAGGCLRCPGGVDRRGRRRGRHVDRGSAGRRGGRGAARRAVPDRTVRRRRRGQGRRERRARVPADRPGLVRGRVEGPAHRGERRPGAGPRDRHDRYPARRRGPGAVRAGGVQPGAGRGVHPVPDRPAGCAGRLERPQPGPAQGVREELRRRHRGGQEVRRHRVGREPQPDRPYPRRAARPVRRDAGRRCRARGAARPRRRRAADRRHHGTGGRGAR